MKNIIWMMRNAFKVVFKDKKNALIFLLGPVICIMIAVTAYGHWEEGEIRIGVVNEDQDYIANDTVKFFTGMKNIKVEEITQSEMQEALTSGSVESVIYLEKGFTNSIEKGNPSHIQLISIKGAEVTTFIESYLYQYLGNVPAISKRVQADHVAFKTAYNQYQQESYGISAHTVEDTSKNNIMTVRTMGFLIIIMFFTAGNLAALILKEKEKRTYFRLMVAPISAKEYVLSNAFVNVLVMVFQIIITIILMKTLFKIDLRLSFMEMFFVMSLFAVVTVGISLCIVAFAKSSAAASAIQNVIVTPTCMLSGCFFPLEVMPEVIQKIANFLPQTWVLETIAQLQGGAAFSSLYMNILVLLAFGLTFVLLAIYQFSRKSDVTVFR
ncbi:ABC transporter permease [Cytobacillus horneckiae]|uniref:ABC transporter permease n=1 Tax=Cytobacillus horneckiae TaxID=549687 RepID=UPI0034CF0B6B